MSAQEEIQRPSFAGLRVMVVEENEPERQKIQSQLEMFGCKVIGPADSVQNAQERMQKKPFDIVLLDVMPYNDTVNVIAQDLKARKIPFAYVTEYEEKELKLWNMPRAFILQKPVTLSTLAGALAALRK